MSNITLRDYHHLIETLLDSSANSEAIFHCTHILESFPKEIKTYQQLGQALLENKRYADAAEVFAKVLSALPDDFMAHAGLSAIHEENRDLDKAIWHMERAFETQPSNPTIQDELRRLISRRDGAAPSKIRLTRGALIRMYAKGELYQQAIAEAQAALQSESDRIDLKLLLAKMYIQANDYSEASDVCDEILNSNPYCFEANRIMFEISASLEAREKSDDIYLQRLIELDPYYDYLDSASDDVKAIPADRITLEKADYAPNGDEISAAPDWVNRIGIPWQEDNDAQSSSMNDVFINDFQEEESELYEPFQDGIESLDEAKPVDKLDSIEDTSEDIPEWIAKAGWIRASDGESTAPDQPEDKTSEIYAQDEDGHFEDAKTEETTAKPAEELPEWLRSLNPEGEDSPQIYASADEESIQQSDIPPLSRDMLSELLSNENNETDDFLLTSSIEESEESREFDSQSYATNQIQSEPVDESMPDLPDWLKDLDTSEPLAEINDPLQEERASSISVGDDISSISPDESKNDLDFIEEIGESDLISQLEPEITEEEITNIFSQNSQEALYESDQFSTELTPSGEDEDIVVPTTNEEPVKEEAKPAVPSWVRNILSNAVSSTSSEQQAASAIAEIDEEKSDLPALDEEPIEELITELPADQDNQGVISEEVTGELESWLDEFNPEKDLISTSEIESSMSISAEDESAEISLENLSTPDTLSEIEGPVSVIEEDSQSDDEILERSVFEDRFSAVFETEGDQNSVEKSLTAEEELISEFEIIETSDITPDRLLTLLRDGDYTTYLQEVEETDLSEDASNHIISELHEVLRKDAINYELWQNLGDLYSQNSDWPNAIKAYREAENQILNK